MELVFPITKPNAITKTVSKVTCKSCDSQFLMHVKVETIPLKIDMSKPLTRAQRAALESPLERKYASEFEIIRLTAEAKNMIVEKVSKRDTEPQF